MKDNVDPSEIKVFRGRLTVGGQRLDLTNPETAPTPEQLYQILMLGRHAINVGIMAFYNEQKENFPGPYQILGFGPVSILRLSTRADGRGILTPKGLDNGTSIHTELDEIKKSVRKIPLHPYWDAVLNSGYTPEVRRTIPTEGTQLFLQMPK